MWKGSQPGVIRLSQSFQTEKSRRALLETFRLRISPYSVRMRGTFNFSKKETVAQVFQVFSCEFCEIPKNIFFYRTPLGDCFCSCIYRVGMRMVRNSNQNYDHKYKEFEVQIFSILCNKNKQEPCLNADYKELQNFHFIQTD